MSYTRCIPYVIIYPTRYPHVNHSRLPAVLRSWCHKCHAAAGGEGQGRSRCLERDSVETRSVGILGTSGWEHGPKSTVESGDFTKENHVTYWKINTCQSWQDFLMSSKVDVDKIKRIKVSGYSKMFHSAIFYKQRRKKNEHYQAGLTTKRLY